MTGSRAAIEAVRVGRSWHGGSACELHGGMPDAGRIIQEARAIAPPRKAQRTSTTGTEAAQLSQDGFDAPDDGRPTAAAKTPARAAANPARDGVRADPPLTPHAAPARPPTRAIAAAIAPVRGSSGLVAAAPIGKPAGGRMRSRKPTIIATAQASLTPQGQPRNPFTQRPAPGRARSNGPCSARSGTASRPPAARTGPRSAGSRRCSR